MKSADNTGQLLVSQEYNMVASEIQNRILTIRGTQVLLDRDLAELYGVSTKALNQAVKRNIRRFPDSFMFQLTKDDFLPLPPYIGVLAFNQTGQNILRQMKRSAVLPVITRQSDVNRLSPEARGFLERQRRCDTIRHLFH